MSLAARRLALALLISGVLVTPALAQDGPAPGTGSPGVPGEGAAPEARPWTSTIGFELKTTTHNADRSGRTEAHSLMRYVIPKPDFTWTEDQRRTVERWDQLNVRERTAFFFENYKGGHNATNFVTDARKAPFLDGSVSWYESMNIPHIEVRSKPFESKEEAMREMRALRADVRETIAFHTHYRFPYLSENVRPNAAELTDWMRRTSWAIWLNRARISDRSDFVLKAMDNTPVNVSELDKARGIFEGESTAPSKDIIERRGIRVTRLAGEGGKPFLDIEFRGLMKDIDRIERYIEAADKSFRTGEFGPFRYTAESALATHEAKDAYKFRTFGWHGTGEWTEAELKYLENKAESVREALGVRTTLTPEEFRGAIRRMATADTEAGKKMLLPTSWEFLFMPLEKDVALPQEVRDRYLENRAEYMRKLVKLAERVRAGEFGKPGSGPLSEAITSSSEYKASAVASRARRILLDFVKEPYKAGGRSGTLGEFYELSLFEPREVERLNEAYSRRTGREGFAGRRAGTGAEATELELTRAREVFETLRGRALERSGERAAATVEGSAERLAAIEGLSRLAGVEMEIAPERGLNIEYDRAGNRVVVSEGLLGEIASRAASLPAAERAAFQNKVLGLMLGHELAHAGGLKAERVADAEAVELLRRSPELAVVEGRAAPLTEAEIRSAVRTFTEAGTPFTNVLYRLKNLAQYGTVGGREANLLRAAAGQADPLVRYRRADGTLRWSEVVRDGALKQGAGVAHFALALFLKELAVVVQTGDRIRIEEFFDGLMTTDFFVTYGAFSVGAQAGNVAYSKYLERYIKPGFVSGILRTNIVLATGMALPEIIHGTFEGRAFAISVGSLGLSSVAVKAGVEGIRWVVNLKKAEQTGQLVRNASRLRQMARVGGWFYTAAETAVVLYIGDEIAAAVTKFLDDRAARGAIEDATDELFTAIGEGGDLSAALDAFQASHIDYRNHLYRPLLEEQAVYEARLERVARDAKRLEDERTAARDRLERYPALREAVIRQHGSVEAWLASKTREDEASLDAKVDEILETYDRNRTAKLEEIYGGNRREGGYLQEDGALWVASGAKVGGAGDPASGTGFFDRRARASVRDDVLDSARGISGNRLQAYEDELAALNLVRRAVAGQADKVAEVEGRIALLEAMRQKDAELFAPVASEGAVGALGRELSGE